MTAGDDILLNDRTATQVNVFVNSPRHALGIFGNTGMGKYFLAKHVASRLLGRVVVESGQYVHIVRAAASGTVTIEQVRGLINFLRLKSVGDKAVNRVVIVEDAHRMTVEAQNALLKTLEEPPRDAIIIITATSGRQILPTIHSRVMAINVEPVSREAVMDFYSNKHELTDLKKNWLISGGRLGLLHSLLSSDDHPLIPEIARAKQIIGMNNFERLTKVEEIIKHDTAEFLEALQIVSGAGLIEATKKTSSSQIERWQRIKKHTYHAIDMLSSNVNQKLLLTDLLLQI